VAGDGVDVAAPAADPKRRDDHQVRRHRVKDGDTLPNLADKYWGRSDRYWDLYEANRHVLQGPDLLPIGAEIVIPPRSSPQSHEHSQPTPIRPPRNAGNGDGQPAWAGASLEPVPLDALGRSPVEQE
jgi:phage tail protein X